MVKFNNRNVSVFLYHLNTFGYFIILIHGDSDGFEESFGFTLHFLIFLVISCVMINPNSFSALIFASPDSILDFCLPVEKFCNAGLHEFRSAQLKSAKFRG